MNKKRLFQIHELLLSVWERGLDPLYSYLVPSIVRPALS